MSNIKRIFQCVPNFSEGRDLEKVEKIVESFRGKEGVKLLDYSSDKDHNRTVVTLVGEGDALKNAMIEAVGKAIELIDLRNHSGEHPRMGACDVVPFIPIRNVNMEDAIALAKEVAKEISEKYNLPIFLYEKAATNPERENLAKVRKGQFEGMKEKLQDPNWTPDFGPKEVHESAGVTAVGARMPLVAFNVNLDTSNIDVTDAIAKKIRFIGGGLRFCKAMGVELKDRGITQVSMNMTDFTKTALYRSFEMVKMEAKRYGVNVVGSEIVGLVPMEALIDVASYYMGIEDFTMDQVLESRLME
ncbi:glutamate formimidoyltransferase [Clostridium hydrogeniformans]|uniref:glutamate formimidoyltransferase n=1 Tax=Clostridium hydrogeniformans TaxID=349933 RepID=UPI000550E11F|nr:glutamate formimidoyltransferase [Clostridium hydrogeniformans]